MKEYFSMNNPQDLLWLRDVLQQKGIYPENPGLCTKIKETLHGNEKSNVQRIIEQHLSHSQNEIIAASAQLPPVVTVTAPPAPDKACSTIGGIAVRRGKPRASGWLATIYGPPGVGKSTLASQMKNCLIVDVERGLERIECCSVRVNTWEEFEKVVEDFALDNEFDTLAIDSLDIIERKAWEFLCKTLKWKSIETPGWQAGYVHASELWLRTLEKMKNISQKGKKILFIAHSKIEHVMGPEGEGFDRHDIDIHKRSRAVFMSQMDAVFFCFQDHHVRKNENNKMVSSTGDRLIATSDFGYAGVKNRFGLKGIYPMNSEFFDLLI